MQESEFTPIYGQCECGTVRYRVDASALELYHCHCSRCRRLHGALFATYAYVKEEQLTVEQGRNNLTSYRSPLATWFFCQTCGCHLLAKHDHNPGALWYMPATLDEPSVPGHPTGSEKHIFVDSKSPVENIADDLPQYATYAPADVSITAQKTADS